MWIMREQMSATSARQETITKATRFSYGFMLVTIVLVGLLHLGVPFIATLFAFLALNKSQFTKRGGRWLPIVLFLIVIAAVAYGLGYVVNQAVRVLPHVAEQAIPWVIQWAKEHSIELPFTDYDSLKDLALDTVKSEVQNLGQVAKFARGATAQFAFLIVACVVAIGLFLNPRFESEGEKHAVTNNMYSMVCQAITERFKVFYQSFAMVMGAQIVISAINTVFTGIFVLIVRLPNAPVVIGATFLCGLLPVVGNLVSNSIVVGIAITVSPRIALAALIFLVVIHKMEYFLNSKIVGDRIRNPFWLTLLALILGERLMGIPGLILAPVVLSYIKLEASRIPA